MKLALFVAALDTYLEADQGRDYCPNGLQVEGRAEVQRVALGVSASAAFLERAAEWEADAAVVHHGLFWQEPREVRLVRALGRRVSLLVRAQMSLLAYHLPLDRHLEVGNNAVLARRLGAGAIDPAFPIDGLPVGVVARLPEPVALGALAMRIAQAVGRDPLVIAGGPAEIQRIGIVTGGAPRILDEAIRLGLDLFLTGESTEHVVHLAREEGIHFVAAGHHATERFGVQALGEYIGKVLGLETRYFEIGNPA